MTDSAAPASPKKTSYIGRFAPSPSGPLHMGSLVAALASYMDARSQHGKWLMRMEDLDPPRESKEAADQILFALESLGLDWDGPVLYQSSRDDAYQQAIHLLETQGLVFACNCTRQQIQGHGGIYPGICRTKELRDTEGSALRCRVNNTPYCFEDRLQGEHCQHLEEDIGDFVIMRKDRLFAYQLAVVVDDGFQGITHVVRGIDLMDSTPRQLYLQEKLNLPKPSYMHIPVIINDQGQKLSKQHFAAPIDPTDPAPLLIKALQYLGQNPAPALQEATAREILAWGVQHWNPAGLSGLTSIDEISRI